MRPTQQRTSQLDGETHVRPEGRLDPTEEQRVGERHHRLVPAGEPEVEAGRLRRTSDPLVGPPVRVGDRGERFPSHAFQLAASLGERTSQRRIVEPRESVVSQRVKAEIEQRIDQLGHILQAESDIFRHVFGPRYEPFLDTVTLFDAHRLDASGDLVNALSLDGKGDAFVEGVLQALPPEGMRLVEGRPAQKERGRSAKSSQERGREPHVRSEVVVECDSDREALPASPLEDRLDELLGSYQAVRGAEVQDVGFEACDRVRGDELARGIPRTLGEPVVHECDPRSPTGRAQQKNEDARERMEDERASEAHRAELTSPEQAVVDQILDLPACGRIGLACEETAGHDELVARVLVRRDDIGDRHDAYIPG